MDDNYVSVDQVLEYAIEREEQAALFYRKLAERVTSSAAKAKLEEIALEEIAHKGKLESIKRVGFFPLTETVQPVALELYDFYEPPKVDEGMEYQSALILAIKREADTFRLYKALADMTDNDDVRSVMEGLAAEEAKHKRLFELDLQGAHD
jgi:rubrerythrin